MSFRQKLLFILLIFSIILGVKADLTNLNTILTHDLAYAQKHLEYLIAANYNIDYHDAQKDLDMAFELAGNIEEQGEVFLRRSRIKLEDFWLKTSYCLPATTRMAYLSADECTRKILAKDLKNYLTQLSTLGFNGIIVETMQKDGTVIYPNIKLEQYRLLQGSDPIKELALYAKELDLDLFLVMNLGFAAEGGVIPVVASKHPDWVAISEAGGIFDSQSCIYLNIVNPDVRKYYLEMALELVDYNIKGLILKVDLPSHIKAADDFSYDAYSRKLFEQQYGYDPLKEKGKPRIEWDEWRKEQINSLVGLISRRVNLAKPSAKMGALLVLDDLELESLELDKYLNWQAWISRGYIQYFIPRIYRREQFIHNAKQFLAVKGDYLCYPFLSQGEDLSLTDFLCTVNEIQLGGGIVLGDLENYDQMALDALGKGPFKKKTLSLHRDFWRALMVNISELEAQAPENYLLDLRKLNDHLSKLVMAPPGAAYKEILALVRVLFSNVEARALSGETAFEKRMLSELNLGKRLLQLGVLQRNSQGKKLY